MHRQKARSHFGVGRSGGSRTVFVASIRFKIFLSTTFGPDRSLPFGPKRCITPAGCLGIKLSMPIQTSTVPGFQPAKSTDVAYLPPVTLIWPCVFVNFSVGSGSRIMPECCKSKSITVPSGRSTVPSMTNVLAFSSLALRVRILHPLSRGRNRAGAESVRAYCRLF